MVEYHEPLIQADRWPEVVINVGTESLGLLFFGVKNGAGEAGCQRRFRFHVCVCVRARGGEGGVGGVAGRTYLVNRVVHLVLQDGLCDSGREATV